MLKIRALVKGLVIADIPVGNLFLVEAMHGRSSMVDASAGVTVQIVEDDKPVLERRYTEAQLYPHKHDDD
jgi:hypothetical protein